MNKQDLIEKVFNGGSWSTLVHLNEKQANKFIDYVVDESNILKKSRVIRMNTPKQIIWKIWIGNEIFHPATHWEALDPSKRITADVGKIELSTQEIIWEVRIFDDELEDNIEWEKFKEHLMQMISKKAANQLERASLYSRKMNNPTNLNQMFDWFITRVNNSWIVVDANLLSNRNIDKSKLWLLRKAIPTKYRNILNELYIPDDLVIDFELLYEATANTVNKNWAFGLDFTKSNMLRTDNAVRNLSGHDASVVWAHNTWATEIEVNDVTWFEEGQTVTIGLWTAFEFTSDIIAVGADSITLADALPWDIVTNLDVCESFLDGADVLMTPNYNFIYGIQRDITIEPDRQAKLRATDFVITMRIDFQVENPEMTGLLKNLKVK